MSDPLLGWTTVGERQYYVRQFRNMKGNHPARRNRCRGAGRLRRHRRSPIGQGHARTSSASMIAGYVGRSDKLDRAMARFARACADQTEADHAELVRAVRRESLAVTEGALDRDGSAFRP